MPWLINAQQVDSFRKNQKNLVVLDASWYGPDNQRAKQEYIDKHIPGARFFDINLFNDPNTSLPNVVSRDEKLIAEQLGALGLRPDCKVILYDRSEFHSSCRALWMLKLFGHSPQLLYILDGGLDAWEKYEGKVESGESPVTAKSYSVKFQEQYCRSLAQMKANLQSPAEQVIDARHAIRYTGGKEPRPGIRSGHIPGSFCFPFIVPFESNGTFLPPEKLRRRLEGIGVDLQHPTTTLCGSGITAAILNFIFDILGNENNALFNGSWTEWGAENLYPGEASLAERPVASCI